MGLDMFLYGCNYYSQYNKNGEKIRDKPQIIKTQEIVWRKAQIVHNWFVENIQGQIDDCKTYELDYDNLNELIQYCKNELEYTDNEWIIQDLSETIEQVNKLINNSRYEWFEYSSSW